jgi:hypothetical protein
MGLVAISYGPSGHYFYGPLDHLYGPLDHLVRAFRSPCMGLWNHLYGPLGPPLRSELKAR